MHSKIHSFYLKDLQRERCYQKYPVVSFLSLRSGWSQKRNRSSIHFPVYSPNSHDGLSLELLWTLPTSVQGAPGIWVMLPCFFAGPGRELDSKWTSQEHVWDADTLGEGLTYYNMAQPLNHFNFKIESYL